MKKLAVALILIATPAFACPHHDSAEAPATKTVQKDPKAPDTAKTAKTPAQQAPAKTADAKQPDKVSNR